MVNNSHGAQHITTISGASQKISWRPRGHVGINQVDVP
ncbi:MAG: hypothetical protein ACLP3C_01170 [Mycobacterium sp.]